MAPERASKHLVTREPTRECDFQYGLVSGTQTRGGAFQAKTQRVSLKRFAGYTVKQSVKSKTRHAGPSRDGIERNIVIETTIESL